MLKLADTSLILINPSPSNVKQSKSSERVVNLMVMFFKIVFYLYCKMSLTFSVMNYTSLLYFAEFIIEPLRKHQQYSTQLHNGREIIK